MGGGPQTLDPFIHKKGVDFSKNYPGSLIRYAVSLTSEINSLASKIRVRIFSTRTLDPFIPKKGVDFSKNYYG